MHVKNRVYLAAAVVVVAVAAANAITDVGGVAVPDAAAVVVMLRIIITRTQGMLLRPLSVLRASTGLTFQPCTYVGLCTPSRH